MKPAQTTIRLIFLLLFVVIVGGCTVPQTRMAYKAPLTEQGALYFYLQPLPQEMQRLSFTITGIDLIPEQGSAIPFLTEKLLVRGRELAGIQTRLASQTLPPGRYRGIALSIGQASMVTEEGETSLSPPGAPIRVELHFSILQGRSQALFLVLSPEYLVTDGFSFTPRFALGSPSLPPRNFMGFISNSSENIVTVFNKRSMEVAQVITTGVGPRGMALDQNRGIVYVANGGDDTIELISAASMSITGRIRLRFGDEPTALALTPDGRTLLSANAGTGTVSIIDTRSLSEKTRLNLDPDPAWIIISRDGQRAFVLHTLSNTISRIDLARPGRFSSLALEHSPLRGTLSRDGEKLYVITQYATELLVVDTRSFEVTGTVFVGGASVSVTADPKNNLVYVGKKSGEIVIVDPASGMFIDS
ncbi:MAG: YncE family protein, partial [Desulfofustis sp.]|nr:YncE family protein [Desulfofustis sp.]